MAELLQSSLVRILGAKGRVVGAGVLVDATHVVTCAHVISAALGQSTVPEQAPSDLVSLDFPFFEGTAITAKTVAWQPILSDESGDIAVLQLHDASGPSNAISPLRTDLLVVGRAFRTYGFPAGYGQGVWAYGQIKHDLTNGLIQLEDTKTPGYRIQSGFSGAPVWDEITGEVLGIITLADRDASTKVAFMIPTALIQEAYPQLKTQSTQTAQSVKSGDGTARKRIFISYKHCEPDSQAAMQVAEALSQYHEVFIDRHLKVGEEWASRIETALDEADFFIPFISQSSINSEMVRGEIEKAHRLGKGERRKPVTLPVRLAYRDPLPYPLSAYLDHIQYTVWSGAEDTPRILEELREVISGGALVAETIQIIPPKPDGKPDIPAPTPQNPIAPLEIPGGAMPDDACYYIDRNTDARASDYMVRVGVTLTIKGPRQTGKSSLLVRLVRAALDAGKQVAYLDFQLMDNATLENTELFFRRFCASITDALELPDQLENHWVPNLGAPQNCSRYMRDYVLKAAGGPVFLAIDETETVLARSFQDDFFGMLRSWHNGRAIPTTPLWKRLDLVLVTSTEPYNFIVDKNQSPFNVGEKLEMKGFTLAQIKELNRMHGYPLTPTQVRPEPEQDILGLLGGQPYLTRRAFYQLTQKYVSSDALFDQAATDMALFGDHLRYHLFRLNEHKELREGLLQVIRRGRCQDEKVCDRLEGAGLVTQNANGMQPSCQLYADYFGRLND